MKKISFKVAITGDDHLYSIQKAAFAAGCEWIDGKKFRITGDYLHCEYGLLFSSTQEAFEHSERMLLHTPEQIYQLAGMPPVSKFKEGQEVYFVDLLTSPCVREGRYSEFLKEAADYNLVYPKNQKGFFSAVEKAKQLLELALIPF